MNKEQTIQKIDRYGFFYKMGVLTGQTLLSVEKFDSFEKMIREAERIDNTYKSDMCYCSFCFQAFKDDTYNFGTSCFFQYHTNVNGISRKICDIERAIIKAYKMNGGE